MERLLANSLVRLFMVLVKNKLRSGPKNFAFHSCVAGLGSILFEGRKKGLYFIYNGYYAVISGSGIHCPEIRSQSEIYLSGAVDEGTWGSHSCHHPLGAAVPVQPSQLRFWFNSGSFQDLCFLVMAVYAARNCTLCRGRGYAHPGGVSRKDSLVIDHYSGSQGCYYHSVGSTGQEKNQRKG